VVKVTRTGVMLLSDRVNLEVEKKGSFDYSTANLKN
jgi:hypothetical protein